MRNAFAIYRSQAMTAAKELGYSKEVQRAVYYAKTSDEIERIMTSARKSMCKEN